MQHPSYSVFKVWISNVITRVRKMAWRITRYGKSRLISDPGNNIFEGNNIFGRYNICIYHMFISTLHCYLVYYCRIMWQFTNCEDPSKPIGILATFLESMVMLISLKHIRNYLAKKLQNGMSLFVSTQIVMCSNFCGELKFLWILKFFVNTYFNHIKLLTKYEKKS